MQSINQSLNQSINIQQSNLSFWENFNSAEVVIIKIKKAIQKAWHLIFSFIYILSI